MISNALFKFGKEIFRCGEIIDQKVDSFRESAHIVHVCFILYITPEDFKDLVFSRNDNIDKLIENSINIMTLSAGVVFVLLFYKYMFPVFMTNVGIIEILLIASTGVGSYMFAVISLRNTAYELFLMFDKHDVPYEVNIAISLMYKVWGTIFAALALFLLIITSVSLTFPAIPDLNPLSGDSNWIMLFLMGVFSLFFIGFLSTIKIIVAAVLFTGSLISLFYGLTTDWYYLAVLLSILLLLSSIGFLVKFVGSTSILPYE